MKYYSFSNLILTHFPSREDLANPYIFKGVQAIINVSRKEYPEEILNELVSRRIEMYHYPLSETEPDMGMENVLDAVRTLDRLDKEGKKILLHCAHGKNRSKVVAEAFYFLRKGEQIEDNFGDYLNHLVFNCETRHLPPLTEVERRILELK